MFEVPQPGEIFTGEDGTVSTVLPDTCDPDYEPEQDELEDYAEFIGIDIHKEPELLYIAREGLRTPLPPEWRACETSDKEIYYFNFKSGESLWDHPLDDVFKEKVVKARAAGTKGGGKEGGKKATSTTAPAPTATKAASPASGPRKASGSTKAVADALFGGKKPSASASLGPLGKPLTDTLLGRPLPDVSDLLSGNMSGSPVLNSSSLNSSTIKFGSPTLGKRSGAASPPQPMMGAKDIEGAMRKRIEEEFAPLRRSTSTRMEKQLQEERDRLEKELAATQAKLKSEYDAEKTSKSAQQRVVLAKEEKDLQAAWEKRLKELQEHLEVLTKKVDVRGKEVESVKGTTIGELKQSLTAKKADDVNAKRAELEAKMQQELTQLEEEQRCALDELQKRGDAFVADSTSRIKADNDKKLAMQSELGEKMVATLQATVTQKQAELDDVIKKVQQAVASLGAPAAGQSSSGATLSRDALIREAVANAQREADSETEAVGSTCAAKLTQAKAEGKLKLDRLREELEAEKTRTAQASSANTSIMTELNVELSPEDQQRLKVEEDTLQKDLTKALENFTNQTDMMVRGKQKAFTATPSPANDERASEAASAKHYAALRELEKEHEDAVTKLKSEHQRRLTTKSIVDPRKVPTFAKLLGEKKRAWLLEHPAPSQELPKLEPIPKWTPPVMGMQSAAVELPPPEEQKRIVEPHVQAARALIQEERESALQALEKEHKAALETFRSSYHTQKKDLLDAALAKRREILLAKSSPATPSTNAAASSTAAISTVEAAISAQKKQHDATVADVKKKLESIDRQTREAEEELESNRAILAERRASAAATKAASPVANPPVVEEVIQEELIADYETYIDEDAARCEEAAVHDKWRAFIARLQSSVADRDRVSRSMTSATSTAITTEKPPAFPLRNSANNSNLGRSAIPPPQDSSVHTLLPGSDGPSLSLVTPIAHRSRGEEHQRRLESDFGSSSLWSTPRGPTVTMRGETSAGSPLLTPYSQVHVPASSLTGEPRVLSEHFIVEQDDGVPLQQEGSWSAARLHQEDLRQQAEQNRSVEDCGQRLAAVRIMLQDRRQELQSRVIQMESLRQEWRTDMHECRRRHNRSEEQLLRKVKSELESDARQLNRLIEQYKEASRQLRHEERQFSDLQDSIKYRGAALVAPSGATPNQLNEGQVSDGVAHALFRVVERLDFLLEVQRKQLKRQRQQDQLRVVRSERHTSRHHSAPISSRKARQVWVEENLDDATPSPRKRHNHARRQSSRRHSDSKGGIAQPMPWSGERSSPSITAQGAIQSAGVAARHAGRRWPSPGPDERDVSPKETGEGASSRAGRRGYPHRQKHIEHWLSEQA